MEIQSVKSFLTFLKGGKAMGFKNIDAEDLRGFPGFVDLGSDAFWKEANAGELCQALELLRSFYDGA